MQTRVSKSDAAEAQLRSPDGLSDRTRLPLQEAATPRRDTWSALRRGFRGRCPACGEGRLLHHYLKVVDACPCCGEEMHHHRADDFPAYVTILIVGHVLVGLMFAVDEEWPDLPLSFHFMLWPALVVVMSLWLLPIVKGGLVAYQWALRMHGFETAHQAPMANNEATPPNDVVARHSSAA